MLRNRLHSFQWLWITAVILLADQLCKLWVSFSFHPEEYRSVNSWFGFTLLHNKGAAFSFLDNATGWQRWFFILIALVVSSFLLMWIKRSPKQRIVKPASAALILGGAIGNLLDRLLHGYVIDFIVLHYKGWFFPAFNIADAAITAGAAILILKVCFEK